MPRPFTVLLPVLALVAWTFGILLLVAFRRVGSSFTAGISPKEYAFGESAKVPPAVVLANLWIVLGLSAVRPPAG